MQLSYVVREKGISLLVCKHKPYTQPSLVCPQLKYYIGVLATASILYTLYQFREKLQYVFD
jgi:hypothetical protein